jgi:hypothetical protein
MNDRGESMETLRESVSLRDATVQELQAELLRRTSFNSMSGQRVLNCLLAHRHLWIAFILDRAPLWTSEFSELSCNWLIKLRDLSRSIWNVDTLYVLTPTVDQARELEQLANGEDDWGGEVRVHDDPRQIEFALGVGRKPYALMSVWWD